MNGIYQSTSYIGALGYNPISDFFNSNSITDNLSFFVSSNNLYDQKYINSNSITDNLKFYISSNNLYDQKYINSNSITDNLSFYISSNILTTDLSFYVSSNILSKQRYINSNSIDDILLFYNIFNNRTTNDIISLKQADLDLAGNISSTNTALGILSGQFLAYSTITVPPYLITVGVHTAQINDILLKYISSNSITDNLKFYISSNNLYDQKYINSNSITDNLKFYISSNNLYDQKYINSNSITDNLSFYISSNILTTDLSFYISSNILSKQNYINSNSIIDNLKFYISSNNLYDQKYINSNSITDNLKFYISSNNLYDQKYINSNSITDNLKFYISSNFLSKQNYINSNSIIDNISFFVSSNTLSKQNYINSNSIIDNISFIVSSNTLSKQNYINSNSIKDNLNFFVSSNILSKQNFINSNSILNVIKNNDVYAQSYNLNSYFSIAPLLYPVSGTKILTSNLAITSDAGNFILLNILNGVNKKASALTLSPGEIYAGNEDNMYLHLKDDKISIGDNFIGVGGTNKSYILLDKTQKTIQMNGNVIMNNKLVSPNIISREPFIFECNQYFSNPPIVNPVTNKVNKKYVIDLNKYTKKFTDVDITFNMRYFNITVIPYSSIYGIPPKKVVRRTILMRGNNFTFSIINSISAFNPNYSYNSDNIMLSTVSDEECFIKGNNIDVLVFCTYNPVLDNEYKYYAIIEDLLA